VALSPLFLAVARETVVVADRCWRIVHCRGSVPLPSIRLRPGLSWSLLDPTRTSLCSPI
jgi:hypothetical protein